MVVIEGIRRSGKSHTLEVLGANKPDLYYYKDKGVMYAMKKSIDVDDYVIGRDLTYAQLFYNLPVAAFKNLVFDRQYWTSYVYGQFYRDKYNKEFWVDHIHSVENMYGELLENICIVLITLSDDDFKRIAEMQRQKDHLESADIDGYKRQYELYQELLDISNAAVVKLPAFQSDDEILKSLEKALQTKLL